MTEHYDYNDALKQQVVESVSRIPIEYTPQGWEKLSKELDAELPVNGGKTTSILNTKLTRFGTSLTLVTLFLSLTPSSEQILTTSTGKIEKSEKNYSLPVQPESEEMTIISPSQKTDPKSKTMGSDQFEYLHSNQQKKKGSSGSEVLRKSSIQRSKTSSSTVIHDSSMVKPHPKEEDDSIFIFW